MPLFRRLRLLFLFALVCLLGPLSVRAQGRASNDGFQRRDGVMYIIRNGEKRPMPQDVHLPNGRTVTRDGFVVEANGQRTELAEGRGCTLLGTPTAVVTGPGGQLALAAPGSNRPAPMQTSAVRHTPSMLDQLLGRRGQGHKWGHFKKHGKGKRGKHD